jgi:hypothetical protein
VSPPEDSETEQSATRVSSSPCLPGKGTADGGHEIGEARWRNVAPWLVPLALLVVCIITYGLFIPRLGYYWDDWFGVWTVRYGKVMDLIKLGAAEKPLAGWLGVLPAKLLGNKPLHWHAFALLVRWLCVTSLWSCLASVWPRRKLEVAGVAILFAVYPGFSQQPISQVYWFHFFTLGLLFVSWRLSILPLRRSANGLFLNSLAALFLALSLGLTHYYFGLEIVRGFLIWLVLSESVDGRKKRVQKTLVAWAPCLLVLVAFAGWRLFVFKSPVPTFDVATVVASARTDFVGYVATRVLGAAGDLLKTGLLAWVQTLPFLPGDSMRLSLSTLNAWVISAVIGLLAAAVAGVALWSGSAAMTERPAAAGERSWMRQAVLLGIAAMVVGGIPGWFAYRFVDLRSASDRFAIPLMLGACLMTVGVIHVLLRSRRQRSFALLLLVVLSAAVQLRNGELYKREWTRMKSIAWQLYWRVPQLNRGSALLMEVTDHGVPTHQMVYNNAFNLIYLPPPGRDSAFPFRVIDLAGLYRAPKQKGLWPDSPLRFSEKNPLFRFAPDGASLGWTTSVANVAMIWLSPSGSTLWFVDPVRDEQPEMTPLTRAARALSNPNAVVLPEPANSQLRPPSGIFGEEPRHGWHFFFQKICLARQFDKWQIATALADSARQLHLKPEDESEWLPFVEAYLMAGRSDDARVLVTGLAREDPRLRTLLVDMMDRVRSWAAASEDVRSTAGDLREALNHAPLTE